MSGQGIPVVHRTGSYQIHLAPGGLDTLRTRLEAILPGRDVALITDQNVDLAASTWLRGPIAWRERFVTPAGEAFKTRRTWSDLTDRLLESGFGRETAIIALGGGMIGDLAGFVAATYMRGVPFVQVPTSLLAMVDASVGGKVGVDTPRGKNLVGAFHPPAAVITDPHALETLPEAQYRAGLAETVKHGLTQDAAYLAWIEGNAGAILARSPAAVHHLVRRSIELKAAVVQRDEMESGERAILNAGHTVAHGLESASGFSLSHGEAVAIGLVAECRLAAKLGLADPAVAERVENILISLGLPVHPPAGLDRGAATEAIRHDKKNRAGAIRFSLPEAPGRMHRRSGAWTVSVAPEVVATLMREM